jgi:hypothetical protein
MSATEATSPRPVLLPARSLLGREALASAGLFALGAAAAAVCLALTLKLSFLEFFPGEYGTSIFLPQMITDWEQAVAAFLLSYAALLVIYALVLRAVATELPSTLSRALVFAFPIVFVVILSFMYPPWSLDFVHNVSDGRTLWLYGDNPMVTPPHGNPFPVLQFWGHLPAPYGPLWFVLLFPVLIAGESAEAALHIVKLYQGVYYLATAGLIYLIARRVTPGRELFAFVLYAWNPFVFLRVVGSGHNDLTMIFFVVLAVWLLLERRWRWAIVALTASALVKYATLMLGPALLLWAYWSFEDKGQFWRETAAGAAISAAMALALFAWFYEGTDTFDSIRNQSELLANSPAHLLGAYLVLQGWEIDRAAEVSRWLAYGAFIPAYCLVLAFFWRSGRSAVELLATIGATFFAYIAIGSVWYQPWYLLWPLTFLVLVPGRWAVALCVALTIGGLLPDFVMWYGTKFEIMRDHHLWRIATVIGTGFIPAALVLCWGWLRYRRLLPVDGAVAESGSKRPSGTEINDPVPLQPAS